MNIGVCGVRGLGLDFLKLFSLHPEVALRSFADINSDVRAKAEELVDAGVSRVSSFEALLETDIDSVAILTPPWTHADLAIRALESGRNVLSACPAALSVDELRSLVDTVEETGRIYMIAETSYYYPCAIYSRTAWKQGRFGDFVYGEGEYYYRPHAYGFWIRDYYANMPPMLYPTHSTTMVLSVTGKRYRRVVCIGTPGLHPDAAKLKRRAEWGGNETSNMSMLGELSGGGVCRINEMRNVGCKGEIGSIIGTEGSIREHSGNIVWTDGLSEQIDLSALWRNPVHHPQTGPASLLPGSLAGEGMGHQGSHRFLADEFIRAVTQNKRPHNHVWAAASYCAPGIAAWDSLRNGGEWTRVSDFGEPKDGREPLEY